MPAWLALTALRGFAGRIFSWLGSLNGWQLLALGLGVALIVDHVALIFAHRHSAKLETQIVKLDAQLKSITSAKDQQKVVTQEKIRLVTQIVHDADQRAKVVEAAPLPGNCRSPKQVLDADI